MSRRTNLTTLRSSFSWNSFWYSQSFYTELVYLDIKITEYLTGIFYSMCLPTSYFYIKRLLNGIVIIEADIFLVGRSLKKIVLFSIQITIYYKLLSTIGTFFLKSKKKGRKISNKDTYKNKYNRFIWFFRFSTYALKMKYNLFFFLQAFLNNGKFIKLCKIYNCVKLTDRRTNKWKNKKILSQSIAARLINIICVKGNLNTDNIDFNFKTFYNFFHFFFSLSLGKKYKLKRFSKWLLYFFSYNVLYTNRINYFTFTLLLKKNVLLCHDISVFRLKGFAQILLQLRSKNKKVFRLNDVTNNLFNDIKLNALNGMEDTFKRHLRIKRRKKWKLGVRISKRRRMSKKITHAVMKNKFYFRRRRKKALSNKIKRFSKPKLGWLFWIRHIIDNRINSRFFMRKAFFLRKLHVLRFKQKTKRKRKLHRIYREKILVLFLKYWNLFKLHYRNSSTLRKVWFQVKNSLTHDGPKITLLQRFSLCFLYFYVLKSFFLKLNSRTYHIGRHPFKRRARKCIIRRAGAYSVLNKRMKWYKSVKGVLSKQEYAIRRTKINYQMPWKIRVWYLIQIRKKFLNRHRSI